MRCGHFHCLRVLCLVALAACLPAHLGIASAALGPDDVLLSGGQHCCSLEPLTDWMGAKVTWGPAGKSANIICGGRTVVLQSGIAMMTDAHGMAKLLPTCPIRRDGKLYVPTRAVVEAFGGTADRTPSGLQLSYQGRTRLVPMATKPTPGGGMERIMVDLADPRVPLEDMQDLLNKADQIRKGVDTFNSAAGPMLPGLQAISKSRTLKLLGHIPYIGKAVSLSQDAAGATTEAVHLSKKMAKDDETQSAPLRRALQAAWRVQNSPTAESIRGARPAWQAALPAIDQQLTTNRKITGYVGKMRKALVGLDKLMKSHPGKVIPGEAPPNAESGVQAADQFLVLLQLQRWNLTTYRDYFGRLLADSTSSS